MKAWRYYGRRDLRFEEVPIPKIQDDEVLIKVTACGICQTDVDEFIAGPKLFQPVPFIPGHEFGGVIVEVGKKVEKNKLGKVVTVAPLISCGKCEYCRAGRPNLCEKMAYYGIIGKDGGFAEYAVVKAENAIEINDPEIVHFGEICLIGLRVLNLSEKCAYLGKKALVVGSGAVGLCAALLLKSEGWQVEICEIREKRRAFANSLGFTTYEVLQEVPEKEYTVVVDCAGEDPVIPYAFSEEIPKVKKGGRLILVGIYFSEVCFDPMMVISNEIEIIPSFCYTQKEIVKLPKTITSLAETLKKMNHKVAFENLKEALLNLEMEKDNYLKIVVNYGDS